MHVEELQEYGTRLDICGTVLINIFSNAIIYKFFIQGGVGDNINAEY